MSVRAARVVHSQLHLTISFPSQMLCTSCQHTQHDGGKAIGNNFPYAVSVSNGELTECLCVSGVHCCTQGQAKSVDSRTSACISELYTSP